MKNIKSLRKDDGVVGIVAAFLIVGLIVAVIAMIQTQYVPKWMSEKEADHMNEVSDQFAKLKYAMDIHSASEEKNTLISTTITLGSKEMPYLMSVRAFGNLNFLNNGFNISFIRNDSTKYYFNLGLLKYSSFNSYYINQNYIFEGGAIILSQDIGNVIYIKPSFSGSFADEENFTIIYKMIDINTQGNRDSSVHGYGPVSIHTEYTDTISPSPIINISNMTITTNYPSAWGSFINRTLINSGLNYNGYNTNYSIDVNESRVFVDFKDNIHVNLEYEIIRINAQIYGRVER